MAMKSIAVVGASGKTGRKVVEALAHHPRCRLGAAIVSPQSRYLGSRVSEVPTIQYSDALGEIEGCSGVIDFSTPDSSIEVVARCVDLGLPVVVATTGHTLEQVEKIREAGRSIPVALTSNTSLGAAVLAELAARARVLLGDTFDCEIFEVHHRGKRDAPSGTARTVAEAVVTAIPEDPLVPVYGRGGLRSAHELGISSARGGDVPGDHTAYFFGAAERIEITHRVQDRAVFGIGAVVFLESLIGRSPGIYGARSLISDLLHTR